jgi:hypothetical protein
MSRHILMLRVTVKDGELAFLTRNGRLERVLEPGRHRFLDPRRALAAEVFRARRIPGGAVRGAQGAGLLITPAKARASMRCSASSCA